MENTKNKSFSFTTKLILGLILSMLNLGLLALGSFKWYLYFLYSLAFVYGLFLIISDIAMQAEKKYSKGFKQKFKKKKNQSKNKKINYHETVSS